MKRLLTLLTVLGFAFTLGVAFADETPAMSIDRTAGLWNGITYFDLGTGCSLAEVSGVSGSAAGGMREGYEVIDNGVTFFAPAAEGSIAGGQCVARSPEEGLNIDNGVTYFGPHPEGM